MKIAVYSDESVWQLVLTPEGEWEKKIVDAACGRRDTYGNSSEREATIVRGSFYECQGGWHREGTSQESVIIRFQQPKGDKRPEGGGE